MARIAAILLAVGAACALAWWVASPTNGGPPRVVDSEAPPAAAQASQADTTEAVADSAEVAPRDRVEQPAPEGESGEDDANGLRVIAIDSDNAPVAGVPIAVGLEIPFERRAIRVASGITDEEGKATLQVDPERWLNQVPLLVNPELMIDAKVPHADRIRIKVSYEDALASETRLQVPLLSRIRVIGVHADGSAPSAPLRFSYRWAPAGTEAGDSAWSRYQSLPADGAQTEFLAGPGVEFTVSVWDEAGYYESGTLRIAGPANRVSDVIEHTVAMGPAHPRLRARLWLPDGEPAASESFQLHQRLTLLATEEYPAGEPQTRWQSNEESDSNGWVDLALPTNDYLQRFDREWTFVLDRSGRQGKRPALDAEGTTQVGTPIPRGLLHGQVLDMPDLRLATIRFPLLVSGRTLDAEGKPVATDVWLYPLDADGNQARQTIWRGKSDREGYFEARAVSPESGQFELSVGGRGWSSEPYRGTVGEENITVEMYRAINVRGSVILDDGLPWPEIEVRMPPGRAKRLGFGGGFMVDYVPPTPETYVWFEHNGIELWRSANFSVSGEGDVRPTAIQDQDLRGSMRGWTTTLVDGEQQPLEEGTSVSFTTSTGLSGRSRVAPLGYWVQLTRADVGELEIRARGYEPLLLSSPLPEKIVLRKSLR